MKTYNSILETIGNTPLIKLNNIMKKYNLHGNIYAKVEFYNPGGSIKDRAAYKMIVDAEKNGLLKEGSTIIEPTSGNTGIGIAMIATIKGYRSIIVMPENMSEERKKIMRAYGSELVLTDANKGMAGSIEKANELNKNIKNSIILGQFDNYSNALAHYNTTGPEIFDALEGKVDAFISGIGTGGTITGTSKYLKEKNLTSYIVGVEPLSSPFITKKEKGKHLIQGIGAGFIPSILETKNIDEMVLVSDEEAYEMSKVCALNEGLLVGISSGAALCAAIKIASRKEFENKNIVVVFPDNGGRYLSVPSFLE